MNQYIIPLKAVVITQKTGKANNYKIGASFFLEGGLRPVPRLVWLVLTGRGAGRGSSSLRSKRSGSMGPFHFPDDATVSGSCAVAASHSRAATSCSRAVVASRSRTAAISCSCAVASSCSRAVVTSRSRAIPASRSCAAISSPIL